MEALKNDLKKYGANGLAMLTGLTIVSTALVAMSLVQICYASGGVLLSLLLLALLLVLASSRQVIKFPGTHSGVSMTETVTFLAIISRGPYPAILLTLLDV